MIGSIGGTFHSLHEEHKNYIKTAFRFCDFVYIILTTDKYAQKKYALNPIEYRKYQLEKYLKSLKKKYKIIEINSTKSLIKFMTNTNIDLVHIVHEYYPIMKLINNIRITKKLKPFLILIKERMSISSTSLMENNNEM